MQVGRRLEPLSRLRRQGLPPLCGTGTVDKVLPKDSRVVVGGINMVQRHTKPSQGDPQGGIKNKEASLHISNVAIVDASGKPTRVGFRMDGDKKVRFAKTTGDVING